MRFHQSSFMKNEKFEKWVCDSWPSYIYNTIYLPPWMYVRLVPDLLRLGEWAENVPVPPPPPPHLQTNQSWALCSANHSSPGTNSHHLDGPNCDQLTNHSSPGHIIHHLDQSDQRWALRPALRQSQLTMLSLLGSENLLVSSCFLPGDWWSGGGDPAAAAAAGTLHVNCFIQSIVPPDGTRGCS